ncbi:unnamed protein product [Bursaphelenchus xylophilus]|uniref:(pine wood nematode) hypothetical protein n=1 Tax=Bursaphelenchus xylophilus TaxID=6326 RepID=A0A1I7S5E8_BURXY|nr:unnamed protein product [Bursaphelenchus xylophilus]CAG9117996.1 unnamed protein product [Bursaphelenchus xylophilus]
MPLSYIKSDSAPVPIVTRPFHVEFNNDLQRYANEGRTAFICAETGAKTSYTEFLHAADCVNAYLKSIKFGYKDVAAIITPNCWEFPAIFLGVTSRGGVFSGASPLFTETELSQQFQDNGCKVVFCAKDSLQTVLRTRKLCPKLKHIVVIDNALSNPAENITSFPEILRLSPADREVISSLNAAKDLIMLPYSSGTTGKPKGVMLTHQNWGTVMRINNKHANEKVFSNFSPKWDWRHENILFVLPYYHVYGFGMLWMSLLNGGTAVVMRKFVPELLLKTIQNYRIRFAPLVPPIMVFICGSKLVKKYDLTSLEFILSAAAPAGKELVQELKKALPSLKQVGQAYGLSETSLVAHCSIFGEDVPGSSGKLVPNFEQKIIDRDSEKIVPLGEVGEICVRSPTITIGYLNRPVETAETIDTEGWLHTGDLGYLDKNGYTFIVDRAKDLIKVKGLQVAPAELEDILLSHDKIKDAAVVGIPHARFGEAPKAFVVKTDSMLTAQEVDEFVSAKCAPYKRLVGGIEFVKEIPKSATGKILRRQLRDSRAKL